MYLYKIQRRFDEQLEVYKNQYLEPDVNGPRLIQNVVGCIHQHLFDQRLTLRWVKERCLLDGISLSIRFKYYMGQPPQPYWIGHRLKAAKILLRDDELTEASIGDIAFNLGYGSYSAFAIAFKKYADCTPKTFRGRHAKREKQNTGVACWAFGGN